MAKYKVSITETNYYVVTVDAPDADAASELACASHGRDFSAFDDPDAALARVLSGGDMAPVDSDFRVESMVNLDTGEEEADEYR